MGADATPYSSNVGRKVPQQHAVTAERASSLVPQPGSCAYRGYRQLTSQLSRGVRFQGRR